MNNIEDTNLVERLILQMKDEKNTNRKGGIYYITQVELAYNSNRIEGSRLSKEHTYNLFETSTILPNGNEVIDKNDIIETSNHFHAFNYILNTNKEPLTEKYIKYLHYMLKQGTDDAFKSWFNVGEYKKLENFIGEQTTSKPENVSKNIRELLTKYNKKNEKTIEDVIDFHVLFEKIHPFQDGNGRVGRLIMFKECLNNGIVPFIIDNEHKLFYYRGLREYDKEKGYLIDTCKSAQDKYRIYCDRLISKEIDITLDKFIKICINKNYSNLKVLNECLKNNFIEFKDKTRIEKQKIVKDKIKNIQKNEKDLSR